MVRHRQVPPQARLSLRCDEAPAQGRTVITPGWATEADHAGHAGICAVKFAPRGASLQSRGADLPAIGVAQEPRQSGEVHRHSPDSFSGEPSGRLGAAAGAGGDSPLQQQPPMHSLPWVDATRRQELRTNFLHVAEEPHFIIATRLVARREMFRGPSIPFGNDNLPGGISVAVCYRFCSAPSAHASALNLKSEPNWGV